MFRSMYPLNVHSATNGNSGSGISIQAKKTFAVAAFIGLSIFITVVSYMGGAKYHFGVLAALLGLVASIGLDIYLYNLLLRDKFNESFESDSDNKIFKLFRIRMSDTDNEVLAHGVQPSLYTSGEIGITLRIEIGNITESGEVVTEEFLDRLFKAAHQLQLKIKHYSMRSEWRKSKVYHNHLRRLSKVQDTKLRNSLSAIDAHQAKIFEKGKVQAIHINFYTRRKGVASLNAMINFVENWREENLFMASIRDLDWLTKEEVVEAACSFLGLKMLDITRSLTKKNVKYDVRRLVRVYSRNRFEASDVEVESEAVFIRRRKQ